MTIELGTSIDGRYRVERLIGVGGMGAVYAVRDTAGAELAIKVVRDGSDPVMCKRFQREAEAARALSSEHATRVFATGNLEDGRPYMVMELLAGRDLQDQLEATGPLSPADAIDVVVQVCDALGEAHEAGLVHRDIKPANIFMRRRRDGRLRVKLLDFGVSKVALTDAPVVTQLTQVGTLLGSPHYMSPEQLVSSSDVDARADIWSVGATLYELLSGVGPFSRATVAEVVSAVLRDPPDPLRAKNGEVPEDLEAVVLRCLEKDVELRLATVAELVDLLQATQAARRQAPPRSAPRSPAVEPTARVETMPTGVLARSWWWVMAAFVAVAVGGTLWFWRGQDEVTQGETLAPNDEWIVGQDRELKKNVQDDARRMLKQAQGKLVVKRYDAAVLLATEVEASLVAEGLVLHTDRSRLAQYAALIQARAFSEQVIALVRKAGKDDDPLPIISKTKEHLRLVNAHVKRAAAWDQHPMRCISMASATTHAQVLAQWRRFMTRMAPARLNVAKNWESSLSRQVRRAYDDLLLPSSALSKPCRKAVEKEKRSFATP